MLRKSRKPKKTRKKNSFKNNLPYYAVVLIFVIAYISYKLIIVISQSLFVNTPERINFVMYGQNTSYYSLDIKSGRHYQISFPADLNVNTPGGYGQYRVGSLGKLAKLDNNKTLIKNTFATTTSTFVDFYFLNNNGGVFYGDEIEENTKKPSVSDVIMQKSNASFLDRLYLALRIIPTNDNSYTNIRFSQNRDNFLGENVFQDEAFTKNSIGLLYQSRYRDEQKSVQILYPSRYITASQISSILEGNGIRVSDVGIDIDKNTECKVVYTQEKPSETAKNISRYFGCNLEKGSADVYDIIFFVGQNVERDWKM